MDNKWSGADSMLGLSGNILLAQDWMKWVFLNKDFIPSGKRVKIKEMKKLEYNKRIQTSDPHLVNCSLQQNIR